MAGGVGRGAWSRGLGAWGLELGAWGLEQKRKMISDYQ